MKMPVTLSTAVSTLRAQLEMTPFEFAHFMHITPDILTAWEDGSVYPDPLVIGLMGTLQHHLAVNRLQASAVVVIAKSCKDISALLKHLLMVWSSVI